VEVLIKGAGGKTEAARSVPFLGPFRE